LGIKFSPIRLYCLAKGKVIATQITEAGFEYVTGGYDDGGEIFRKRK
jgi:hypothetical protein